MVMEFGKVWRDWKRKGGRESMTQRQKEEKWESSRWCFGLITEPKKEWKQSSTGSWVQEPFTSCQSIPVKVLFWRILEHTDWEKKRKKGKRMVLGGNFCRQNKVTSFNLLFSSMNPFIWWTCTLGFRLRVGEVLTTHCEYSPSLFLHPNSEDLSVGWREGFHLHYKKWMKRLKTQWLISQHLEIIWLNGVWSVASLPPRSPCEMHTNTEIAHLIHVLQFFTGWLAEKHWTLLWMDLLETNNKISMKSIWTWLLVCWRLSICWGSQKVIRSCQKRQRESGAESAKEERQIVLNKTCLPRTQEFRWWKTVGCRQQISDVKQRKGQCVTPVFLCMWVNRDIWQNMLNHQPIPILARHNPEKAIPFLKIAYHSLFSGL